jgi:ferric-dicitrate binding protein FerR (iron transport regulator)
MNHNEELIYLLYLKLAKLIDPADDERIEKLLKEDVHLRRQWEEINRTNANYDFARARKKAWRRVKRRIMKREGRPMEAFVGLAALLVGAVLGLCIYFYAHPSSPDAATGNRLVLLPAPVRFMLPNGKHMDVWPDEDNPKEYAQGLTVHGDTLYISGNADTDLHPVQVDNLRAAQYHVSLPDGSHVQLDSASSLTVHAFRPVAGRREVQMHGRAYFSIKGNADKPFIVHAGHVDVRVLGTSFSVNADQAGHFSASLFSGRIQVCTAQEQRLIYPGDSVYWHQATAHFKVIRPANRQPADYQFIDCDLALIPPALEEIYPLKVIVDENAKHRSIHGRLLIQDHMPLEEVLSAIGQVDPQFRWRLSADTLYIR